MRNLIALFIVVFAMSIAAAQSPEHDFMAPGAKVEKLAGNLHFIEGPVWIPMGSPSAARGSPSAEKGFLIFSDIPASKLMKWDGKQLSVFREDSHASNGNTIDNEGRLVTAEHGSRTLTRTETDGKITTLADLFDGRHMNSPNDVVVQKDGFIWFTDPPYGVPKGQHEELGNAYVFCLNPETKQLHVVAADFDRPNGLAFSPDEKKLYIADSGNPRHIRVFDVTRAHLLRNGRIFCTIDNGVPDGIRVDKEGNVWSSAGDGVQIFSPEGKLLQRILVPESPANLCFGGADNQTLFVTARTSLYSIRLAAPAR
jgi:gluconolactonase